MKTQQHTIITFSDCLDQIEDPEQIHRITKRSGVKDRMSLDMDLTVCIAQGYVDPDKLEAFDDANFFHDIHGITQHMDRESLVLTDCFLPRSAPD